MTQLNNLGLLFLMPNIHKAIFAYFYVSLLFWIFIFHFQSQRGKATIFVVIHLSNNFISICCGKPSSLSLSLYLWLMLKVFSFHFGCCEQNPCVAVGLLLHYTFIFVRKLRLFVENIIKSFECQRKVKKGNQEV